MPRPNWARIGLFLRIFDSDEASLWMCLFEMGALLTPTIWKELPFLIKKTTSRQWCGHFLGSLWYTSIFEPYTSPKKPEHLVRSRKIPKTEHLLHSDRLQDVARVFICLQYLLLELAKIGSCTAGKRYPKVPNCGSSALILVLIKEWIYKNKLNNFKLWEIRSQFYRRRFLDVILNT